MLALVIGAALIATVLIVIPAPDPIEFAPSPLTIGEGR